MAFLSHFTSSTINRFSSLITMRWPLWCCRFHLSVVVACCCSMQHATCINRNRKYVLQLHITHCQLLILFPRPPLRCFTYTAHSCHCVFVCSCLIFTATKCTHLHLLHTPAHTQSHTHFLHATAFRLPTQLSLAPQNSSLTLTSWHLRLHTDFGLFFCAFVVVSFFFLFNAYACCCGSIACVEHLQPPIFLVK